jgi:hypothetical protein
MMSRSNIDSNDSREDLARAKATAQEAHERLNAALHEKKMTESALRRAQQRIEDLELELAAYTKATNRD